MKAYRQLKKVTGVRDPEDVRRLRVALEGQGITGDDRDIEDAFKAFLEDRRQSNWVDTWPLLEDATIKRFVVWASLNYCDDNA